MWSIKGRVAKPLLTKSGQTQKLTSSQAENFLILYEGKEHIAEIEVDITFRTESEGRSKANALKKLAENKLVKINVHFIKLEEW